MIATRSIKIENVTVEQNTVAATMFGANTLQSVNTSDSGVPFAQYETAIFILNNLLVGSTADALAPDLVAFWIGSAKNAQGYDLGVTLVLPTDLFKSPAADQVIRALDTSGSSPARHPIQMPRSIRFCDFLVHLSYVAKGRIDTLRHRGLFSESFERQHLRIGRRNSQRTRDDDQSQVDR